jgi:hypothetical protein
MELKEIISAYGVPDPYIVGKLPRGGITLDFVGHAEITRILIDVDVNWSWEPCGWDNGRPAIHEVNGMAVRWGYLTILGKTMLGVGSARSDKPDLVKELIGDFIRNASMRFGICLSLWSKSEWDERPQAHAHTVDHKVSDENVERFKTACKDANLDPNLVAQKAGLILVKLKASEMPLLRDTFKKMKDAPAPKPTDIPLSNLEAEEVVVALFNATPVEAVHSPNIKPKDSDARATAAQVNKLKALMFAKGFDTPESKLELAVGSVKHPLHNLNEMTKGEVWELIETLDPQ